MTPADVFVLVGPDGRLLDPAVQATVLAKYSRSAESARDLLQGVTQEDAAKFQEKWGVTYGHSSIAELCTVPYCFEGVSILASKFLERYQRPGYSEKSTRYQEFSEASFVEPQGAPERLRDVANLLYRTYKEMEGPVLDHVAGLVGGAPIEELKKRAPVKARAFDSLRYLLPAGTGTNLAAVVNARDARYMMSDLLGSPVPEFRQAGENMVEAARRFAPVFAVGAKANSFEPQIRSLGSPPPKAVTLVDAPTGAEEDFWARVSTWYGMTKADFASHMEGRGNHQVPDVFKTVVVTFDLYMDYGAFRDLQRHRRCEQYIEPLTAKYGFDIPDDLTGDLRERYVNVMGEVGEACRQMVAMGVDPLIVQYAIPLGYRLRAHFQMDLKQVYYMTELRTKPQGHISYRRIAWAMAEEVRHRYPTLMQWCRDIRPDTIGEHG